MRLRQTPAVQEDQASRLTDLGRKIGNHDEGIRTLFQAIHELMLRLEKTRRYIGFRVEEGRLSSGKPRAGGIWTAEAKYRGQQ